jgi:outer membrane protein assembly factor BamB
LYCNALSDGKLLWKFAAGKPIASSATAADNKIFFSCDDGFVYALDSRNGRLIWKFATKGDRQYDVWDYYRSSPAFYKGRLYVGSGDGSVYALNSVNGKELWHFKTGGVVHADPVVSNDTVYVGSFDGIFYALTATTGKLIWKFKTVGDRFFPKVKFRRLHLSQITPCILAAGTIIFML